MARRPKTTKPSAGQKLVSFNPEASPFKPRPPVGKESVVAVDTNLTTSYGCSAAPTALARNAKLTSSRSNTRPAYEINRGLDLAQAPANFRAVRRPYATREGVQMETLERLVQDHIDSTVRDSVSTMPRHQVLQTATLNSFPGQLSYFAPAPLRIIHRPIVSIHEINVGLGLPGGRPGDLEANGLPVLLTGSGLLGGIPELQDLTSITRNLQPPIGTGRPGKAVVQRKQPLGPPTSFGTQLPRLIVEESENDVVSRTIVTEHAPSASANCRRRQRRDSMLPSLHQHQKQASRTREHRHQARDEYFRQKQLNQGPNPSPADIYPVNFPDHGHIQLSSRPTATPTPMPSAHNAPLESIESTTDWPTPAELPQKVSPPRLAHESEQQLALKNNVAHTPITPQQITTPALQGISPYEYQLPVAYRLPPGAPLLHRSPYDRQQFVTPTRQHIGPYARQQFIDPNLQTADLYTPQRLTPPTMRTGNTYAPRWFPAPIVQQRSPYARRHFNAPTMLRGSPYPRQLRQGQPRAHTQLKAPALQLFSPHAQHWSPTSNLPSFSMYAPQRPSAAADPFNPTFAQQGQPKLNAFGNYEVSHNHDMAAADEDIHWLINKGPKLQFSNMRALETLNMKSDHRPLQGGQRDGSCYGITIGSTRLGPGWDPPTATDGQPSRGAPRKYEVQGRSVHN